MGRDTESVCMGSSTGFAMLYFLREGYTIVYHILFIFRIAEILNTLNKCLKEKTGE